MSGAMIRPCEFTGLFTEEHFRGHQGLRSTSPKDGGATSLFLKVDNNMWMPNLL